jgi:23S rRNA pseudouridine2605 synthase
VRLQAFLARAGASPSRRKAESPILAGRVTINGERATLGTSVTEEDEIALDGIRVRLPDTLVYLALNKPAGYLTTMKDERGRKKVADLMPDVPGLVPAGRLDADTTGLLILTNDGRLALAALAAGPTLEDGKMHPPLLANIRPSQPHTTLELTVHEGRNRIIRRACMAVGLCLISLQRTRVGPVRLGELPEGEYRALTTGELEVLR